MAESTKIDVLVKKDEESDNSKLWLRHEIQVNDVVIGLPSHEACNSLWAEENSTKGLFPAKENEEKKDFVKVQAGPVHYWMLHLSSLPLFVGIYCALVAIIFFIFSLTFPSNTRSLYTILCYAFMIVAYAILIYLFIFKWDKKNRLTRFKLTSLKECKLMEEGSVVRVEGLVRGAPHVPLLTSYYQRLNSCVFTELRVMRPNYVEVHRSKSVNFFVADPTTGALILVKAGAGQPGIVGCWNDLVEKTKQNILSKIFWKLKLSDGPDTHVNESCVREGDRVTVVGKLAKDPKDGVAIVPLLKDVVMGIGRAKFLCSGYYRGLIIGKL